ncbi:unnamed protein product [Oncorhynchus mykiss]|uniref:Uncharacterized protein n=1 Tax=Oncorhynchus mykiss TaxID=8022 RepID=A0A060W738_ONCMY|nr:unnamed protein product [Oncorhynchus mykiss]
MFFILTLLTKTGAPHQENPEPCEKRHRLGNCVVDIHCPQGDSLADEDKAFSRPLLDESRSFFYISKEKQGRGGRSSFGLEEMGEAGEASERGDGGIDLQGLPEEGKSEREHSFLSHHFDIPNFVNSEHSSMTGEDDLLLCEPPALLDSQSCVQDGHHVIS